MKCESCKTRAVEVEELEEEGRQPYRLCKPCHERLKSKALRPRELFNLVAVHGHSYYLHDDFYDYDTGEATQPEIEVLDVEKYPLPKFEQVKNDLNRLIDFAFFQYFIDSRVINQLQDFDKNEVLSILKDKVENNRGINYKAYEIAGKVVGRTAEKWIKDQWDSRQKDELLIFAEAIAKCLEFDEAFEILTKEIENADERLLADNISALLYFQNNKTLDWIEKISQRINNVSSNWGQLAASSEFSWDRADKWLTMGRPLSLVALDALIFCTTKGERLNQSLWMRQLDPKLKNSPEPEIIANRLQEYLLTDSVPRTKSSVNRIIENIFETSK